MWRMGAGGLGGGCYVGRRRSRDAVDLRVGPDVSPSPGSAEEVATEPECDAEENQRQRYHHHHPHFAVQFFEFL